MGAPKRFSAHDFPLKYGPFVVATAAGSGAAAMAWVVLYRAVGEEVCHLGVLKKSDTADDARFERRAQLAMQLDHPNIAAALATMHIDGEMHILEEYVHGVDLSYLKKFKITAPAAAFIAHEVAGALTALEKQQFVHRDIAAENVRISRDGEVKLLDFGFATSPEYRNSQLTAPGSAFAREAYAAPELKNGAQATVRTDVYALGVIFWELLAGARHFGFPPGTSPRRANEDVPPELDAIAAKAVNPDPERRFQNAQELRVELRAWLKHARVDGRKALRSALLEYAAESEFRDHAFDQLIEEARVVAYKAEPLAVRTVGAHSRFQKKRKARYAVAAIGSLATVALLTVLATERREQLAPPKMNEAAKAAAVLVATSPSAVSEDKAPPPVEKNPSTESVPVPQPRRPLRMEDKSLRLTNGTGKRAEPSASQAAVIQEPPKEEAGPAVISSGTAEDAKATASTALIRQARELLTAGDAAGAAKMASEAVEQQPVAAAYVLLVTAQRMQGDLDAAQKTTAAGLNLHPSDPQLLRIRRELRLLH